MSISLRYKRFFFLWIPLLWVNLFNSGCLLNLYSQFEQKKPGHPILRLRVIHQHWDESGRPVYRNMSLNQAVQQLYQTKDRIKFEITTNYPGYIYILNRTPKALLKLLYPRLEKNEQDNQIAAYHTFVFPKVGQFEFLHPKGDEYIAFILSSNKLALQTIQGFAQDLSSYSQAHEAYKKCHSSHTRYNYCPLSFDARSKSLVYKPNHQIQQQEHSNAEYMLLPNLATTENFGQQLIVFFHLKHR